jgi:hypothetical protein
MDTTFSPPVPSDHHSGRPPTQVFQTQNHRTSADPGIRSEIEVPFKISFGYLTPYGNFSYLRGDDLDAMFRSISSARSGRTWVSTGRISVRTTMSITTSGSSIGRQIVAGVPRIERRPEPGFVTHSLSGGYYFRRERFDLSVNLGVSNLADNFYREQFVFAPARGRSFTIGTKIEIK